MNFIFRKHCIHDNGGNDNISHNNELAEEVHNDDNVAHNKVVVLSILNSFYDKEIEFKEEEYCPYVINLTIICTIPYYFYNFILKMVLVKKSVVGGLIIFFNN